MFFSLSTPCVCVCVISSILNIPPVCIAATQLLIKFPATNSRQGDDICITIGPPPSPLLAQPLSSRDSSSPPSLSSLFLSFTEFWASWLRGTYLVYKRSPVRPNQDLKRKEVQTLNIYCMSVCYSETLRLEDLKPRRRWRQHGFSRVVMLVVC